MRISHRYKFVFFCNPKTGSESVREMLAPFSDVSSTVYKKRSAKNPFYSHMRPIEARRCFDGFGWDFNSYTRFVFVRNPWARLVSLYEMIRQGLGRKSKCLSFNQWLYAIEPYGPGGGGEDWMRWRKYGTYSLDHFASDDKGSLLVDKVIRLEDIDSQLIPFLKGLKLPGIEEEVVPHKNKGVRESHYAQYYSKEAAQRVREMYAYDIERFGYDFED